MTTSNCVTSDCVLQRLTVEDVTARLLGDRGCEHDPFVRAVTCGRLGGSSPQTDIQTPDAACPMSPARGPLISSCPRVVGAMGPWMSRRWVSCFLHHFFSDSPR